MSNLEICCDASTTTFPNGRTFGCAGAITTFTGIERTCIVPDATNNKAELMAMYTAIKLVQELCTTNQYDDITIYADSKFVVYGMKVWMDNWLLNKDENDILYNYNKEPVKNQDLFKMIISYMVINNLKIKIRHQKGHVKVLNEKSMAQAARVFRDSNHYDIDHDTLSRISFYNDKIDRDTKAILTTVNPNDYPISNQEDFIIPCKYVIPYNYKEYVL